MHGSQGSARVFLITGASSGMAPPPPGTRCATATASRGEDRLRTLAHSSMPGSLYSATKFGATGMAESAGLELAGSGVRVTVV